MPDLSVVATAHARPDRLAALLDALALQEGVGRLEVIVVADGASADVLRVLEDTWVRVLRLDPGRGPAAARNVGWRAAAGRYVAFTDDDCVPSPGWAAALLAAAGPDDRIVQGRVEPLPGERDRIGPFARTLWVREAGPFFQTANVLYPRALLDRLDGFDERFPAPAGEDTDLGWRALERGADVVFAPDALVHHAVHEPGWRGLVADAPRWGSAVGLVKRHPGLRAQFSHRWFWKSSHEALVGAAAAAALAGVVAAGKWRSGRRATTGLAAVAAARWALVHRGEHPSRGSLVRALPAHLAVDAAEVVALARGSIRARTLLL